MRTRHADRNIVSALGGIPCTYAGAGGYVYAVQLVYDMLVKIGSTK